MDSSERKHSVRPWICSAYRTIAIRNGSTHHGDSAQAIADLEICTPGWACHLLPDPVTLFLTLKLGDTAISTLLCSAGSRKTLEPQVWLGEFLAQS